MSLIINVLSNHRKFRAYLREGSSARKYSILARDKLTNRGNRENYVHIAHNPRRISRSFNNLFRIREIEKPRTLNQTAENASNNRYGSIYNLFFDVADEYDGGIRTRYCQGKSFG